MLNQKRAFIAWSIGGLPVIASTFQAVNALLNKTALYWIPVVGDIARALASLNVVIGAAEIFYSQATVIFTLFLLSAIAWIAQGVLMFSSFGQRLSVSRPGSAGAVVLSGLLYAVLFFGIYSGLLGNGIPPLQLAGFFLIPVVATGALVGAYREYSWEFQRRTEAIARLKKAQAIAKSELHSLETTLDRLPLDRLESISPDAVRQASKRKEEFETDCRDILERIERALESSNTTDAQKLQTRSRTLEQQANSLDADQAASHVEDSLHAALDDVIDQRFGNIAAELVSGYGEQYEVANLGSEYRVVEIPGSDEIISLTTSSRGTVADQLHNAIERGDAPLLQAIELIERVDDKIENDTLPHLHEHEEQLRELEEQTNEDIDRAAEKIDEIGGHTQNALERLFVSGTVGEETVSVQDIRQKLERARRNLHACQLDEALREAESARTMAEEYMETIRFVRSVLIPGIERGKETVSSVPSTDARQHGFFTHETVDNLREPIRNDFGVAVHLDTERRVVTIDHDVEASIPDDRTENVATPESGVKDAVKYLIREVQNDAGDGDVPNEATIHVDSLPNSVKAADPVPEFVEFIQSVDDVTISEHPERSTDPDGDDVKQVLAPSEGYISIKAASDATLGRATDRLVDEYRSWANGGSGGRP